MANGDIATAPWTAVAGAVAAYSSLLAFYYRRRYQTKTDLRKIVKAISAGHSTVTTALTIIALSQKWDTPEQQPTNKQNNQLYLDDSTNSWIVGQNRLADFVTAWEAGYLVYDTGALLLIAYCAQRSLRHRWRGAVADLLTKSPIFVVHHGLLAGALIYLQTYIAARRGRGLRIIVALLLMNASNPVLHLRWWRKKMTGQRDKGMDAALVLAFALTRFGTIYWVVKMYGQHHGLSPWEAMQRQRLQCRIGTGMLSGVNILWWFALVRQMLRRR